MTSPLTQFRRSARRCARTAAAAAAGCVLIVSMAAAAEGYLGIYMQDVTASLRRGMDLPRHAGVLVSGVEEDSPADKAGLREGDVITEVDGHDVGSPDDLRDAVGDAGAGHPVALRVWRDGTDRTVRVTLGKRDADRAPRARIFRAPGDDAGGGDTRVRREVRIHRDRDGDDDADAPRAQRGGYLGVGLTDLTPQLADYFGVTKGGVLVTSVEDDSPARTAGIKAGDVIVSVDGEAIESTSDLREAVRGHKPGATVSVRVMRDHTPREVNATLGKAPRELSMAGPMWFDGGNMFDGRGLDTERLQRMLSRFEMDGKNRRNVIVMPKGDDVRKQLEELREELDQLRERLDEGSADDE